MDSDRSVSPVGASGVSPGKCSPTPVLEPPKKRDKFSISSILGEEEKHLDNSRGVIHDNADACVDKNSPVPMTTPPTSPHISSHRIAPDTTKYNAFFAQFSNPDIAKLYRWPLFWNPWMGMQGSPSTGVPRPPLLTQPPLIQSPMKKEVSKPGPDFEGSKDTLEAGEIIRPIAFRRTVTDAHQLFKNGFPDPVHVKDSQGRSPSPFMEPRRDLETEFKFNESERKDSSFSDSDPNNEFVEIEVDEADDSDNEVGENEHSRLDSDGLKVSSCERKKKTRTVFSRSQIFQLETMFDMKRYLSSSERAGLAKALNMTETQVKIWFQNRRNKWKRQIAAEMEAANMSQVAGQRIMQLPYMYSHEDISRGMRSSLPMSPIHSGHPVVPPSVHHYYGGILRTHTS